MQSKHKITYLPENERVRLMNIPHDVFLREYILREHLKGTLCGMSETLRFDEKNWIMKEVKKKVRGKKRKRK